MKALEFRTWSAPPLYPTSLWLIRLLVLDSASCPELPVVAFSLSG